MINDILDYLQWLKDEKKTGTMNISYENDNMVFIRYYPWDFAKRITLLQKGFIDKDYNKYIPFTSVKNIYVREVDYKLCPNCQLPLREETEKKICPECYTKIKNKLVSDEEYTSFVNEIEQTEG